MKLSTKSTYGLRAMLAIAMKGRHEATSIADIAEKESISVAYLEQLLNKLRHKGLVTSIRGPRGGYVLTKPAAEITVSDIVKALEGNIYPVHCVSAQKMPGSGCSMTKTCVPKLVWVKLAKAINDCLESVTLKDLCAEAAKIDTGEDHERVAKSISR
jgi:Rrf2 family protein